MCIDQAGNQDVLVERDALIGGKAGLCLCNRQDCFDLSVADGDGVLR
jgi:hypothetical protein